MATVNGVSGDELRSGSAEQRAEEGKGFRGELEGSGVCVASREASRAMRGEKQEMARMRTGGERVPIVLLVPGGRRLALASWLVRPAGLLGQARPRVSTGKLR